jgi:segregation and condensation protein A
MNLTLKDFEGPLDLLLHLVKSKKMDIYNIDISLITKEYLAFIEKNDLSIDAYSEYLVMAGELIHLKSKLLLNKEEELEDEYEYHTPDELAARLIEYEKIKTLALDFKELEAKRSAVYTKLPSSLEEYKEKKSLVNSDVTLEDLTSAFEAFLKRVKLSEPLNTHVTKKEFSVEERIKEIVQILKDKKGKVKFLDLFEELSKPYVVVTFLSILNMVKNNEIKITQKKHFGDIMIEWGNSK